MVELRNGETEIGHARSMLIVRYSGRHWQNSPVAARPLVGEPPIAKRITRASARARYVSICRRCKIPCVAVLVTILHSLSDVGRGWLTGRAAPASHHRLARLCRGIDSCLISLSNHHRTCIMMRTVH